MHVIFVLAMILLIGEVLALRDNNTNNRVYKGFTANEKQFPFMVYIINNIYVNNNDNVSICTGSLIDFNKILSAAHCFHDDGKHKRKHRPEHIVVAVGIVDAADYYEFRQAHPFSIKYQDLPGIQESLASHIYMHPKYKINENFDVAIVKIPKPFTKTDYVDVIQYTTEEYRKKLLCYLMGFGDNHLGGSDVLMYFTTTSIKKDTLKCGRRFEPELYCYKKNSNSKSSLCDGDSGAPMVCDNKVYGVYIQNSKLDEDEFKDEDPYCGEWGIIEIFKLSVAEAKRFLAIHSEDIPSKSWRIVPKICAPLTFALLIL